MKPEKLGLFLYTVSVSDNQMGLISLCRGARFHSEAVCFLPAKKSESSDRMERALNELHLETEEQMFLTSQLPNLPWVKSET